MSINVFSGRIEILAFQQKEFSMMIVRATGVVLSLLAMASAAKSATPTIDPQADAILQAHMSAYVAGR